MTGSSLRYIVGKGMTDILSQASCQ